MSVPGLRYTLIFYKGVRRELRGSKTGAFKLRLAKLHRIRIGVPDTYNREKRKTANQTHKYEVYS